MDYACSLRCLVSGLECPGAVLIGTCGEEGPQSKSGIGLADQDVHSALLKSHVREELGTVLGIHFGNLGLDLSADGYHRASALCGNLTHGLHVLVVLSDRLLVDVADIDYGLHGYQMQIRHHRPLLLVGEDGSCALPLAQAGEKFLVDGDDGQKFLGVVHLGQLGILLIPLVHGVVVGKGKLDVYGLDVACGIDPVVHMDDVGVLETSYNVSDDSHLPDVGQELVAQTLALGGSCHQARDVHEFGYGGDDLCRRNELDYPVKPGIRHVHPSDVGLDCAEWIVGSLRRCACKGGEDGGLSDVRKSHDAAVKSHMILRNNSYVASK